MIKSYHVRSKEKSWKWLVKLHVQKKKKHWKQLCLRNYAFLLDNTSFNAPFKCMTAYSVIAYLIYFFLMDNTLLLVINMLFLDIIILHGF